MSGWIYHAAAGEYLINLACFMTDFNRYSTGIQQLFLKSLTGEFQQNQLSDF